MVVFFKKFEMNAQVQLDDMNTSIQRSMIKKRNIKIQLYCHGTTRWHAIYKSSVFSLSVKYSQRKLPPPFCIANDEIRIQYCYVPLL